MNIVPSWILNLNQLKLNIGGGGGGPPHVWKNRHVKSVSYFTEEYKQITDNSENFHYFHQITPRQSTQIENKLGLMTNL